jgi:hypothetical protein
MLPVISEAHSRSPPSHLATVLLSIVAGARLAPARAIGAAIAGVHPQTRALGAVARDLARLVVGTPCSALRAAAVYWNTAVLVRLPAVTLAVETRPTLRGDEASAASHHAHASISNTHQNTTDRAPQAQAACSSEQVASALRRDLRASAGVSPSRTTPGTPASQHWCNNCYRARTKRASQCVRKICPSTTNNQKQKRLDIDTATPQCSTCLTEVAGAPRACGRCNSKISWMKRRPRTP